MALRRLCFWFFSAKAGKGLLSPFGPLDVKRDTPQTVNPEQRFAAGIALYPGIASESFSREFSG
jgi:hypothetical protein